MRPLRLVFIALLLLLAAGAAAAAPAARPAKSAAPPASERPAIDGILEAFGTHDLVALGERPWSKLDSDFRHALIGDPRFAQQVNDIVVEFANARYQPVLDRYLLDLAPVPPDSLRLIWEDASEPGAWDSPVYAYMLEVVRRANRLRPREGRVRVLAGDPPIDWSKVESAADLEAWGARGAHAIGVIEREVIAKKHKALIVYSARNFFRRDRGVSIRGNLTTRLEAAHPDLHLFVVATVPERSPVEGRLDSTLTVRDRPVLVRLADSKIGMWPSARIFSFATDHLGDMADGLLYFGRKDDRLVRPTDLVQRDPVYGREVVRRKALLGK